MENESINAVQNFIKIECYNQMLEKMPKVIRINYHLSIKI